MLRFTVHSNISAELANVLTQRSTKAEHEIAEQVAKDTEPFVPASQSLSLSNRTVVEGNAIIYPGPYARYLYYGKLMVDPETGSAFAKKGSTKILTDKNLVFSRAVHGQAQSHWFEASKAQNLQKWVKKAEKVMNDV